MFYGRVANNKIIKLHEKCLRINYTNKSLSFKGFLEKDESVSLHHRNLRIVAKMLKAVKCIFPETMKEVFLFWFRNNINLRQIPTFYIRRINIVHYSENSLSFLGSKT